MRVAVLSTPIFRVPVAGYAGLEHLAWQTAAGLAQKGHQVFLVAPDGSECPGVTVVPCGPERTVDERMAYGGCPEVRHGDVVQRRKVEGYWPLLLEMDVVVDHTWNKFAYMLKMEGRLKAPVLGVCHAPVNTMYQSLPPVEKPCFVCISRDQADHFEALFSRPARVCPNGIDPDFYKPTDVRRTDRYLFLARFSTIKGPHLAIEACREAGAGLDLVGDTSITQEPEYFETCKRACDGERIKMVGPATRGECVWWMSRAHGFLHPNRVFREPLGLAPLEAMACGCPVIAWRYGALKETVRHGETGYLVESPAEMADLLRGDAVAALDRRRCREWVADNFSLRKMVDRYDELITEAVEAGGW